MTPEQKRLDAIKLFRQIRSSQKTQTPFTGPDMTEYELVTPIAHLDNTFQERLQQEINQAASNGKTDRVLILKNRMAAYRVMRNIALDNLHSYGEKDWKIVEQNFKQEIKERSARIQDAMNKKYGKGTQKAKDACKLLCGALHGNFDILYANLYNKLFEQKKKPYTAKPESVAALMAYQEKKIRETGIKPENYLDDGFKNKENRDALLGVLSAAEGKYHFTKYPYQSNYKLEETSEIKAMANTSATETPTLRYNGEFVSKYRSPNFRTAIPGFPQVGVTAHHESFHRLVDSLGQYIRGKFEPNNNEFDAYCAETLLNALLAEDLDMEIKKITGHASKACGRQMSGCENHGVTDYSTVAPEERLADVYQGLATKDPKDFSVAEMALSNILEGGEARYASKVLEFLSTPAGKEYAEKIIAFRRVFDGPIRKFQEEFFQKLGQNDWTKNLTGNNQSLLRNRIARMIGKNHDLDVIKSKLQRLKDATDCLLVLQKTPAYNELLATEIEYLDKNTCISGLDMPFMYNTVRTKEYYALENLFSKLKKGVKALSQAKQPVTIQNLITYIKQKQFNQVQEAKDAEAKFLKAKTDFLKRIQSSGAYSSQRKNQSKMRIPFKLVNPAVKDPAVRAAININSAKQFNQYTQLVTDTTYGTGDICSIF